MPETQRTMTETPAGMNETVTFRPLAQRRVKVPYFSRKK